MRTFIIKRDKEFAMGGAIYWNGDLHWKLTGADRVHCWTSDHKAATAFNHPSDVTLILEQLTARHPVSLAQYDGPTVAIATLNTIYVVPHPPAYRENGYVYGVAYSSKVGAFLNAPAGINDLVRRFIEDATFDPKNP